MRGFLGALLLILPQPGPQPGAQPGLSAPAVAVRPSTVNVSIGERFQVTVEATGPRGTSWEFPKDVTDGSTELTLSRSPAATSSTAIYDAQVFTIGKDVRLPQIKVQYHLTDGSTGTVSSAPAPINVVSTIDPSETNPEPADFVPPQPVLASRAFWIASAAAGLLLLGALALLVRRLRFPKTPAELTVTPAISPEEQALTALDQLANRRTTVEPRAFYIQLTQILKQYLEIRLEAPVLEMTSAETLVFTKGHAWTSPHTGALRDLVSSADMVKFGGSSDASNADRQVQLVRDLVGRIDRLRQQPQQTLRPQADSRRIA